MKSFTFDELDERTKSLAENKYKECTAWDSDRGVMVTYLPDDFRNWRFSEHGEHIA